MHIYNVEVFYTVRLDSTVLYIYITLSTIYSSDALLPPGTSPKVVAMTEEFPPLPVQTSPPCLIQSSPLVAPLSHMYSFTLSLHLPSGLPMLFGPTL